MENKTLFGFIHNSNIISHSSIYVTVHLVQKGQFNGKSKAQSRRHGGSDGKTTKRWVRTAHLRWRGERGTWRKKRDGEREKDRKEKQKEKQKINKKEKKRRKVKEKERKLVKRRRTKPKPEEEGLWDDLLVSTTTINSMI